MNEFVASRDLGHKIDEGGERRYAEEEKARKLAIATPMIANKKKQSKRSNPYATTTIAAKKKKPKLPNQTQSKLSNNFLVNKTDGIQGEKLFSSQMSAQMKRR